MKKDVFDELIVVKRSGQRVNFNSYKIAIAIKGAFDSIYADYDEKNVNKIYEKVLNYIEENYIDRKTINVEDIQDIIESILKDEKDIAVYKSFSEYRQKRADSRKAFKIKQQHKFAKAMEKIADNNLLKNESDYSPKEILIQYGKTVADEFSKAYLIDNKYLRSHEEGNIYIHDISTFPLGMISQAHLSFDNYFENNDSINNLTELILNAKDEISGEINIPAIDYLLEPWLIKKFKYFYEDYLLNYLKLYGFDNYINIKKLCESINRINNIQFDDNLFEQFITSNQIKHIFITAHKDCVNKIEKLIFKKINKLFNRLENNNCTNPYFSVSFGTNRSRFGDLINKTIIQLIKENNYKNLLFIYKYVSYQKKYLDDIVYLIDEGKRISISFIDSSFNKDDREVEYFANGIRIFENNNSENRSSEGRMLVGMTSINISRIALECESIGIKQFYKELDNILDLVKNELLLTFETIGNKNKECYKSIFIGNIDTDEKLLKGQKIRKVIKNSSLAIGLVGLKECVMILSKDRDRQYELTLDILDYVNNKCELFTVESKLNFIMCEPFESKAQKEFMKCDKTIYGIRKNIIENERYDLISELVKDNYKKTANIQKKFLGGNMIDLNLSKNTTVSEIKDIIEELYESDISFINIKKEKVDLCE